MNWTLTLSYHFTIVRLLITNNQGPVFQTFNQTFESVFESERVFHNFRSSSLRSFFRNFLKVRNRTSFWLKNRFFSLDFKFYIVLFESFFIDVQYRLIFELFPNFFCENFASLKIQVISEKFPNFEQRTFPKLVKMKSSEISI